MYQAKINVVYLPTGELKTFEDSTPSNKCINF